MQANTSKKIKIATLVSYPFLPARTGGEKGIAHFYKFYSQAVDLFCISTVNNDSSLAPYPFYKYFSAKRNRYINPLPIFKILKLIKSHKIDYLQVEHPYLGWMAILLKLFAGKPLIVHSHNIESMRFKSLGKKWWYLLWLYEKFVHRQARYNYFKTSEDLHYAVDHYGLKPSKCMVVPYGIDWSLPPNQQAKEKCRQELLLAHQLAENTVLLLYNGTFSYAPNADGLSFLVQDLMPQLKKHQEQQYALFICGKDIPDHYMKNISPNIFFKGFVDDISLYFKGVHCFLNPVKDGGGIKTKLVEALGFDLFCISYKNGAIGIPLEITNQKLLLATDDSSKEFEERLEQIIHQNRQIPQSYFDYFYWGNIINRITSFLTIR